MKDVMIKITGTTTAREPGRDPHKDTIEMFTEGQMASNGTTTLLVYPEAEELGMGGITTYVTISPDKVKVKRVPAEKYAQPSVMEFIKGQRFEGRYLTPYGSVGLELLTNRIEGLGQSADGGSRLSIAYDLSLKGLVQSSNTLDIEILNNGENNEQH